MLRAHCRSWGERPWRQQVDQKSNRLGWGGAGSPRLGGSISEAQVGQVCVPAAKHLLTVSVQRKPVVHLLWSALFWMFPGLLSWVPDVFVSTASGMRES